MREIVPSEHEERWEAEKAGEASRRALDLRKLCQVPSVSRIVCVCVFESVYLCLCVCVCVFVCV